MLHRRRFLTSAAAGFAGGMGFGRKTWAEDSIEAAAVTTLSARLAKNFGGGRGCAGAMLLSGLEYLEEPRELECLAALFSGGMGLGDHCGFFTAGLMVIGLASEGGGGRSEATKMRKIFIDSWKGRWPVLCSEIKKAQGEKKLVNCGKLGSEAAGILEPLLAAAMKAGRKTRFALRVPAEVQGTQQGPK